MPAHQPFTRLCQTLARPRQSERVEHVRGTPENPMTTGEVVAKASELMTPVLGETKTKKLIAQVMDLQNVKDIRELRPLLQSPDRVSN